MKRVIILALLTFLLSTGFSKSLASEGKVFDSRIPIFEQDEGEEAPATDCGFLGIQCGFIPQVISSILDLIRGFFDFVRGAIETGISLVRGIAEFIFEGIRNVIQIIINLVKPIIDLISGVLKALEAAIHIIKLLLEIVIGVFLLIGIWLIQAVSMAVSIFTTFVQSAPIAIPGLPQCVTAPTNSDICAIYYMADWTVFAPNTPGTLIVPVVTIMVDLSIFFMFLRKILRIIDSGEKVTDV